MTLYHRAADMPTTEHLLRESNAYLTAVGHRRWCGTADNDACECGITQLRRQITAYLAQQSALDELVRENERLGLYDDQKPVAEMERTADGEYIFDSLCTVPVGKHLLYAAPAPAHPRQPLSEWIACSDRLPEHDALRVIVYCTADRPENRMWCAIWNAGDQSFEADGGWFERDEITHWQPAPQRPIERAITGDKP